MPTTKNPKSNHSLLKMWNKPRMQMLSLDSFLGANPNI
jgi:hypothetical protein